MKTAAIVAAQIAFTPNAPPQSSVFGDVYHPQAGALAQAQHVFLAGNGLPGRWQGRERFVILETGFGLGNNFLATWQTWRDDPQRARQLVFVSIDKHPPTAVDLARAHEASAVPELARQLIAAWPPLTPNLHLLEFESGALRLLLGFGDIADLLPALQLQADAFYLDGFAPARNPAMWTREVIAAIARHAAPEATAATWSVARELHQHLRSAGFTAERRPGFGGKRERTVARYAPAFVPRRSPARAPAQAADSPGLREALVIGAGLAGAAAADALARQGWHCTVLERHGEPAQEASGNPGGLFHGTAHADDGLHARFNRTAALLAARRYAGWIAEGRVPGQAEGLLRLNPSDVLPALPAAYVQALTAADTQQAAGLPGLGPSWCYAAGGWISPAALCRLWLSTPGVRLQTGATVARIARHEGQWIAWDALGHRLGQAPALVLATGAAGLPALDQEADLGPSLSRVRGQVSWVARGPWPAPQRPLSGQGYVLALNDERLLFGASTQTGDDDPEIRQTDHDFNRQRLSALCGLEPPPGATLHGRVAWRAQADDRLPLVGAAALPLAQRAPGTPADQCRLVPRVPGLFVLMGLASRGLTWAPLAAEILAAWITGAPMPVEADLLDAVDPARASVRLARRASRRSD